ncbi:MAG: ATP synthase F0 subunit B [Sandaracinaceae bacterium]|nr:ATP synthase F0 subunit B [Sandaracinaceae bacterium]
MSTLRTHFRSALLALALGAGAFSISGASAALAQHEGTHEAAGEHGEAAAAEHEAHAPQWDYFQFAGQLTNFAIWLTLIYMLLNKVLPKYLADRRAGIVDGLEEAKRMKTEAEAKFAEYSKRIETMDDELARVRDDMRKAGQTERDRLVKEAADKGERMHAEARFLVEQQMKQLKEELTREAIEQAVAAAEKILRERTTAMDQQRLADDYLARIKSSVTKSTQTGART